MDKISITGHSLKKIAYLLIVFNLLYHPIAVARDFYITGRVTDNTGNMLANTRISMIAGMKEFAATTGPDGSYSLRVSGVYDIVAGSFETGMAFPVPFSRSVNIPVIINSSGDIRLSIFSFTGKKVMETTFNSVGPGSYRIVWDGCNQNGSPEKPGFYIYSVEFRGKVLSGKFIKADGFPGYTSETAIEPVMLPPVTESSATINRISVITNVTCDDHYPVRLTDISIGRDTTIDFELMHNQLFPFKTAGDNLAMHTGTGYRPLVLKGINLGSSPPGFFPGEIAYAITPDVYEEWINKMAEAGFNSIRVYTLHPPAFYEKLAEYNQRHPDDPLLLFQGIWLEEMEDGSNQASYDLISRSQAFTKEIKEVIDCIHGKGEVAFRHGKSYGRYLTDMSRWTAGYIIGREISPQEVIFTDNSHTGMTSFTGNQLSISGATPTEVFITNMLDNLVSYERGKYAVNRPVSISSWPTLDPLNHPTEIHTDEDKASFNIARISGRNENAGLFASYHAYPYYPNFISQEPAYRNYSDNEGPNSYLGYLNALKAHYSDIPLVIAEFGVPSSWGSAHQSYSNMHHGGYSEQQQGEKNIRLMHNIIDAGCAGGFMFAWMDEWFKPTWIVMYLEAFGMNTGGITIPTRQLWHNLTSPEQNFGLITFEQRQMLPFTSYISDKPSGPVAKIEATNDNSFFMLNIETGRSFMTSDTVMVAFDTYLSSVGESRLPNGKIVGNRSEFLLTMILSDDTASYNVTAAYDMNGLTPRFDLANHSIQQFRSTITDGAPWKQMQWINDGFEHTFQDIGLLPIEHSEKFTPGERTAVAWEGNKLSIRIPWTLLYFHDPTRMNIINGAGSQDGGYNYDILTSKSDGIAVSVYFDKTVTSTVSRYTWAPWLVAPNTYSKEKRSFFVVKEGLSGIPDFGM